MGGKAKQFVAAILIASFGISVCGCGTTTYGNYTLAPNEQLDPTDAPRTFDGGYSIGNGRQLTAEDVKQMNNGNCRIVYGDEGYVTFIDGRFSSMKVENYEDAVASIQSVAGLLGLTYGSEFFASFYSKDDDGYTYYTFQQKYGKLTLRFATLRVVVDPNGYTCALSNSFTSDVGILELDDVGQEAALVALQEQLDSDIVSRINFYPEYTHESAVTIRGITYHAYVIYGDNPDGGDMPYAEFFVCADGRYLDSYNPVANMRRESLEGYQADEYFENMEVQEVTFTVNRWNNEKETITVPVSKNTKNGKYYLIDPNRKIAVAEYAPMNNEERVELVTSDTQTGWNNNDLFAYDRYIRAYDFYAGLGLRSVDGNEIPILVCRQLPANNACYFGNKAGWACFAASDLNYFSESMDIIGHEYTHGVMANSIIYIKNSGIQGAISEAIADIMGNLMEQELQMTPEKYYWIDGEQANFVTRSFINPHGYNQPETVYEQYFIDPERTDYDMGGVHINCSLVDMMAYKLDQEGMSFEEQVSLWLTTIELLTPMSGFEELLAALLVSVKINGFDDKYADLLIEAFTEAGKLNY